MIHHIIYQFNSIDYNIKRIIQHIIIVYSHTVTTAENNVYSVHVQHNVHSHSLCFFPLRSNPIVLQAIH